MPYQPVRDVNIYYEELGRGEPVLFLHSHYSRGILAFAGQINAFSARYRCLFPDFRGHGRTLCDALTWSSPMIADDMAGFLDALGIEKAHLVGYSCGAYVGCYLAARYPERVKSLITIGGGAWPRAEEADDYLPESLLARGETGFIEDMKVRHREAHRGDWQSYLRATVADWKAHPSLTDGEWAAIRCPCLFINGEDDPFGTCQELKERVPHARTYEVKGGGHRPHFVGKQAELLNPMMLEFLAQVDESA